MDSNICLIYILINSLSNEEICEIALDAVQSNRYFALPESLLISMLGDGDEQIKSMAVTKVIALRKELVLGSSSNHKCQSRCVLPIS